MDPQSHGPWPVALTSNLYSGVTMSPSPSVHGLLPPAGGYSAGLVSLAHPAQHSPARYQASSCHPLMEAQLFKQQAAYTSVQTSTSAEGAIEAGPATAPLDLSSPTVKMKSVGTQQISSSINECKQMPVYQSVFCKICNKECADAETLQKHIEDHTPHKTKRFCKLCDAEFEQKYCWLEHMKQHNGFGKERPVQKSKSSPEKLICKLCNITFILKQDLIQHMKGHVKEHTPHQTIHMCKLCNMEFEQKQYLLQHMKQHTGGHKASRGPKSKKSREELICKLCDITFELKHDLIQHMKRHSNIATPDTYPCLICTEQFVSKYSLTQHMREHREKNFFHCKTCGQVFRAQARLEIHERSKHGMMQVYLCMVCSKEFATSYNIRRHIKTVHGKTSPVDYLLENLTKVTSSSDISAEHVTENNHMPGHITNDVNGDMGDNEPSLMADSSVDCLRPLSSPPVSEKPNGMFSTNDDHQVSGTMAPHYPPIEIVPLESVSVSNDGYENNEEALARVEPIIKHEPLTYDSWENSISASDMDMHEKDIKMVVEQNFSDAVDTEISPLLIVPMESAATHIVQTESAATHIDSGQSRCSEKTVKMGISHVEANDEYRENVTSVEKIDADSPAFCKANMPEWSRTVPELGNCPQQQVDSGPFVAHSGLFIGLLGSVSVKEDKDTVEEEDHSVVVKVESNSQAVLPSCPCPVMATEDSVHLETQHGPQLDSMAVEKVISVDGENQCSPAVCGRVTEMKIHHAEDITRPDVSEGSQSTVALKTCEAGGEVVLADKCEAVSPKSFSESEALENADNPGPSLEVDVGLNPIEIRDTELSTVTDQGKSCQAECSLQLVAVPGGIADSDPHEAENAPKRRKKKDERIFVCHVCQRAFNHSGSLRYHMLTHTGEKSHACPQCESRFARSSQLKKHLMTHTGMRPYQCSLCDKRYADVGGLIRHTRVHTGAHPFECIVCRRSFNQQANMNRHLWRVHKDIMLSHKCPRCQKAFPGPSGLERHLRMHREDHELELQTPPNPVIDKTVLPDDLSQLTSSGQGTVAVQEAPVEECSDESAAGCDLDQMQHDQDRHLASESDSDTEAVIPVLPLGGSPS